MKKRDIIIIIIIVLLVTLFSVYFLFNDKENNEKVINSVNDLNYNIPSFTNTIDWDEYDIQNISLNKTLKIKKEGIYNLTGNITDGYIYVACDCDVKLVLDNVNIKNSFGPSIFIEEADNIEIELKDNSVNELSDGSKFVGFGAKVNGTIYSKSDLVFSGNGTLNILSNYKDGIVSKDDITIKSGIYNIISSDDGIRGKDSVEIIDGIFNINSSGDGIKTSNDKNKGYIKIVDGKFIINSNRDGIQSRNNLLIKNGDFNITTSSDILIKDNGEKISVKGIKSFKYVVIENGKFIINSREEGISSKSYIGIKSGDINITTLENCFKASDGIIIDNGSVNCTSDKYSFKSLKTYLNDGVINISSKKGIFNNKNIFEINKTKIIEK